MENISLKLEKEFRKAMEDIMKKHNYMTKTEFIREAIRDKMKSLGEKESPGMNNDGGGNTQTRKEPPSYI